MSRVGLAAFFTAHAGIFMGVHFVFLWALFSGDWSRNVESPADFLQRIVLATGLWIPLLGLFFARGAWFLHDLAAPRLARRFAGMLAPTSGSDETSAQSLLVGLYGRIVIMQFTIILGAMFAILLGSMIPFLIFIGIKTFADLLIHIVTTLQNDPLGKLLVNKPVAGTG